MKIGWRGALGIVLSVVLLAFVLRDVPLSEVWSVLRASDPWLFLAATITGTLIFPLRAIRWRIILHPIAPGLPFGSLWRATAIGMMVNNVVPARAGELARAFALTRETPRVSFSGGIASLAVDRLFDAIVVMLLLLVGMLDPRFGATATETQRALVTRTALTGAVGFGAVLVVLYCMVFFPTALIRLFELFARRLAPRVEQRGAVMLRRFAEGLTVLRHPGRFAAVFAWTTVHWLLQVFSMWLGFRAVGIEAPFTAALLVNGIIAVGVALPSAPGFFGFFEVAAVTGLALYGVGSSRAVSWALGYHILTFIPITLIGAVYFARLGLRFDDFGNRPTDASTGGAMDERTTGPASMGAATHVTRTR